MDGGPQVPPLGYALQEAGVKRHSALRHLSSEHHSALVLALRCQRAPPEEARALWCNLGARFEEELEPHFPREATGTLQRQQLLEFGRLLRAHVRFEEDILFVVAERSLPGPALEALARPRRCPVLEDTQG